jgi:hypothetical protein
MPRSAILTRQGSSLVGQQIRLGAFTSLCRTLTDSKQAKPSRNCVTTCRDVLSQLSLGCLPEGPASCIAAWRMLYFPSSITSVGSCPDMLLLLLLLLLLALLPPPPLLLAAPPDTPDTLVPPLAAAGPASCSCPTPYISMTCALPGCWLAAASCAYSYSCCRVVCCQDMNACVP